MTVMNAPQAGLRRQEDIFYRPPYVLFVTYRRPDIPESFHPLHFYPNLRELLPARDLQFCVLPNGKATRAWSVDVDEPETP